MSESEAVALACAFITAPGRDSFSPVAYQDGGGVWSIGYGFTEPALGRPIYAGDTMDRAVADAELTRIVSEVEARVLHTLTPKRVPTASQLAAMLSFAYNAGTGTFARSGIPKEWNAGRPVTDVADEFMGYVHDRAGHLEPGLITRRRAEQKLFLGAADAPMEVLHFVPNPTKPQTAQSPASPDASADALNEAELNTLKE